MLRLGEIRNARGATRNTRRRGRGSASGRGGTAGKGHKGQLARAGGRVRLGFEGGQMPLYRRLPKKGFTNVFARQFAIVNLADLEPSKLNEVSLETLKESGVLKTKLSMLKILGNGSIARPLKVKAHAVSGSAKEKIEKAGGTVEILS